MNKATIESSSRIPKSSGIKVGTISKFRKDKNSRLTGLSLKNEIRNAKSLPTIQEETVTELNESNSNDQNDKSNKQMKDDTSFTRYKINKLSSSSNKLSVNHQSKTKSDVKISKSLQSRLFKPTKVSLAKKKTKENVSNLDKVAVKKSTSIQSLTKSLNCSLKREPTMRSSTKKDDTSSLNNSTIKTKDLESEKNSNLYSDQIKNQKISKENTTNTIATGLKSKIQANSENEHPEDADLKDNSNDKSIDQESQVSDSSKQDKLNSDQYICRICLDSIQVDDSHLNLSNCSESEPISTNETPKNNSNKTVESTEEQFKTKNYIAPCSCKGQSKFVHRNCLSEWIYVSKKTNCQVCLSKFSNIKINVYKKSVMRWLIDEYDHLLMLILYLIPFIIDCILIFNFLTYDMQTINVPAKRTPINPIKVVEYKIDQADNQLDQTNRLELNKIKTNDLKMDKIDKNSADRSTDIKSFFSSFISFKRTKSLSRTMSLNMFIYNLYFLEIKFYFKNCSICLSGIPVTLLVSFPSLILFIRYCKSRYREWQIENLEVSISD